jgi:hypothetical protein
MKIYNRQSLVGKISEMFFKKKTSVKLKKVKIKPYDTPIKIDWNVVETMS